MKKYRILLDTIYRKVIYYNHDITTADISENVKRILSKAKDLTNRRIDQ